MAYDEQYGTLTTDPNKVQDFIKFKDTTTTDHSGCMEGTTCAYRLPCGYCMYMERRCPFAFGTPGIQKIEVTC